MFVSGQESKYIPDTNESTKFHSQLINDVSNISNVSDLINNRPGDVFLKRLGTTSVGQYKKIKKFFSNYRS